MAYRVPFRHLKFSVHSLGPAMKNEACVSENFKLSCNFREVRSDSRFLRPSRPKLAGTETTPKQCHCKSSCEGAKKQDCDT